jgi:hypothetical protein
MTAKYSGIDGYVGNTPLIPRNPCPQTGTWRGFACDFPCKNFLGFSVTDAAPMSDGAVE